MPIKTNYLKKLQSLETIDTSITKYSYSSGIVSFGLVYDKNGKRITFSKQLAQRLGLDKEAYIAPMVDEGIILVAKQLPEDKSLKTNLKGDDKKISYNAGVTEYLVKQFRLDYSERSSKAFTDITFEKDGDMEVAVIKLSDPIVTSTTEKGDAEDENS